MITLNITNSQAEDILYATSLLYQEYTNVSAEFDEHIRKYNNSIDELRLTLKQQIKEQTYEN